MRNLAKLIPLVPFLLLACSATGSSKDGSPDGNRGPGSSDDGTGGTGGSFDDDFGDGSTDPGPAVATLKGRVFAPEGTIPISGALVYITKGMPPEIPDGAYCDKCVELDSKTPHTFTAPNGQFELGVQQTGEFHLVVQKGQFRRVRTIQIVEGAQEVDKEKTTFPAKTFKPFDNIPKMAIVTGQWDAIDVTLAKLGLGEVTKDFFGQEQVDKTKPHGFDYIEGFAATEFMRNPAELSKYHIVFKPCSESEGTTCKTYSPADESPVQDALREYVRKGGKLYATDYSYEYVRRTWPGFISWQGETSETGSACNGGGSNGPAEVPDPGMGSWLEAMGHKDWEIHDAWTGLAKVSPTQGTDPDGKPATITPTVWVKSKASGRPATVSFENGCGRVMYSTYHTEAGKSETIPQQMALLYVLLEVGVCVAPPVVK